MAVSIVVYAISFLLIRLLSRYRELAADRSGALLTGQPSALSSALQKVSGTIARIPTKDLREAQPLNAFFFVPALSAREARDEDRGACSRPTRRWTSGWRSSRRSQRSYRGSSSGLPGHAPRPDEAGRSPTWTCCSSCRPRR